MDSDEWRRWLEAGVTPRSSAESYGKELVSEMRDELPVLTGSPKQVAWGDRIRWDILADMAAEMARMVVANAADREAAFSQLEQVILHIATTRTTAAWWIDARMHSNRDLMIAATRELAA